MNGGSWSGAEFAIIFLWFLHSGWCHAPFLKDRGECRKASELGSLAPPAFDVWNPVWAHCFTMYAYLSSCLSHCVLPPFMLCLVKKKQTLDSLQFEPLIANICQPNSLGSGVPLFPQCSLHCPNFFHNPTGREKCITFAFLLNTQICNSQRSVC